MKKNILLLMTVYLFMLSAGHCLGQYSVMAEDGKATDYTVNSRQVSLPVYIRVPESASNIVLDVKRNGRVDFNINLTKDSTGWGLGGNFISAPGKVSAIGVDFATGKIYSLPHDLTLRVSKTLTPENTLQLNDVVQKSGDLGLIIVDAGALRRERIDRFPVIYNKNEYVRQLFHNPVKQDHREQRVVMPERPVISAAANGQIDMLKKLLQNGENINETDLQNGDNALMKSLRTYENDAALLLIDLGIDLKYRNYYGQTALHVAAEAGNYELARILLGNGLEPNRKDSGGNAPLIYSAVSPSSHTSELLLNSGADVNLFNNDGKSALLFAITNGNTKTAQILMNKGADVFQADNNGENALSYAVRAGHVNTVNTLLDKGISVNHADKNGNTPLHIASESDDTGIAKLLLSKNPDLNTRNSAGNTPLMSAILKGSSETASLILDKKPELFAVNNSGQTAYDIASAVKSPVRGKLTAEIKKLDSLDSALFEAIMANDLNSAQRHLKNGARVNCTDVSTGNTPVFVAVANNHKPIVDLLITYGADVNRQNIRDNTPLIVAVTTGDESMISKLLSSGANPDKQNANGDTALLWAARLKNYNVMRVLLAGGANPNIKNFDAITPLDIAVNGNDGETERLLRTFGAF